MQCDIKERNAALSFCKRQNSSSAKQRETRACNVPVELVKYNMPNEQGWPGNMTKNSVAFTVVIGCNTLELSLYT